MKTINKTALLFGTAELCVAGGVLVLAYIKILPLYQAMGVTTSTVSVTVAATSVFCLALWAARSIFKDLFNIW